MSSMKLGLHVVPTAVCPEMQFLGPADRAALYNADYLENFRQREMTPVGQALIQMRWDFIARHLPHGARVLDWGGGAGGFARAAEGRGFRCSMFDINDGAPSDFTPEERNLNGDAFDAISLWDVLEHMQTPADWLSLAGRYWLKPGGYFFITTPALENCPARTVDWRHYKPGEHLYAWSALGLMTMFEQIGLTTMEVNYAESRLRTGNGDRNILGICAHA